MLQRLMPMLALLLPGCAASGDARLSQHVDAYGQHIEVLELMQECPRAVVASPNGGCALMRPVRVIFYPKFDEHAREHELDHAVRNLIHGPWVGNCAVIEHAGSTRFRTGALLCRDSRGAYYQREDRS
jgi:hypothetical protein